MKKYYTYKLISKQIIVYICLVLFCAENLSAQVIVPFEQRASVVSPERKIYNIKGDYTMIGNTNLTLVNYGDETSNNNLMKYVDVDSDASTWNSSSSTLTINSENGSVPECSNIIYAGLYWTGRASDGPNSPTIFDYTRSVNTNVPFNQNYLLAHQDNITNTSYNMQVTRGGGSNARYPIYSFSNGTNIYVFSYTNNTGANRVTLSINNGTPINIPVTVTGTTTLTATLSTPYQIVDGNLTISINSLVRSSSTNLSAGDTQSTSFANVNVSGIIPSTTTETRQFDKRKVKIKGPTSGSYTEITANFDAISGLYDIYYPQNGDGFMYSAYAEITPYVVANGLGSYTLADVALVEGDGGGTGFYGGWGIIVVYENSKMNRRDVTIFDGHSYVAGGIVADFEIPVSGFNTVQNGPVNMKLGLMCGEGDRGISGDFFQIRDHTDTTWTTLTHSGNSANNFFNSSINTGGNTRNPNLLNNTGLDISMFNIPNVNNTIITNNQTSTKFRYGTTQDTFIIFTVAMSVDAYEPELPGVIITTLINNIPPSGSQPYTVLPGQEIEYTVNIYNTGNEAVKDNVLTIPIPYGSTYVPNSIVTNLNYTPLPAVNNASFVPGGNGSIVWNISLIPLPANPTTILGTIKYKLRSTTDCAILTNPNCNPSIISQGTLSGVGNVSQNPFNQNLILGYTTGACANQPINGNLVTNINATSYIQQNCQNTQTQYVFNYCNATSPIPVSQISGAFPVGTTFYNQFPVTTNTTQYTSTNPFPATLGTSTYYAVPPNSSGCFFVFNIVITNNFSVTQPQAINLNGCNVSVLSTLPFSTSPVSITANQFINNGGTISNTNLIQSISYSDILIDGCPKLIRRSFVITTRCNDIPTINLTQNININDNVPPTITPAGANITINCPTQPSFTAPTATDNCGTATISVVSTVTTPGNCSGNYSITRTWKATDACGNTSSLVTQTITVQDNTPPSITPAGANATISCPAQPSFTAPTATDTCGTATVNVVSTVTTPGNCAGNYSVTRTWNATDACGNTSASVSQTITVQDNTPPSITPAGANASISCPAQPSFTAPTATDTCGTANVNVVSTVTTPGNCAGNYSVIRTWNATDACGNTSASVSQTITVQDNTPPSITPAGANATISCPAQPSFTAPTATDTCGTATVNVVSTVTTPGNCAGNYSVTRTWNATDACGNTSASVSQTITVQDNTPPSITPAGANATISCPAQPSFTAPTATDTCGTATVNVVSTVTTPGNCAGNYSVIRTWNATDACGNTSASVSQTITVQDNTPPSITPAGANATISCPAQPSFTAPTATDTCGPATVNVVSTVTTPGNCAGNYSVTRTWNATDACGNTSASVSQTITVQDNTPPSITPAGANATISCPAQPSFTAPISTDTCGTATVNVVSTVTTTGNCPGNYTVTRTWNATDACGNTSAPVSQTINVIDTTAPVISQLLAPSTINCPTQPQFAQATATDTCDQQVTLTSFDVTTPGNCSSSYSITRTWTATDDCNNTSTASQTITVQDNTAPTITAIGSNTTISCPAQPSFTPPIATDACSSAIVSIVSTVTTPGNCPNRYTVTRTWNVTDACGNTSGPVSQTINVIDNTPPTITPAGANVTISCPAQPTFTPPTATDTCGTATVNVVSTVTTPGNCAGNYTVTRTWNATDACGNTSASVSQTITVQDNTPPSITPAGANATISCPAQPSFTAPTATDTCGTATVNVVSTVTTPGNCSGNYTVTRTWNATDACGNTSASVSQTITVQDNTPPSITPAGANATISCPAQPSFTAPTATDTCGTATVNVVSTVTTPGNCSGNYTVTRTWNATDDCGNTSASVSQTITVQDNTPPSITPAGADETINCPDQPNFTAPTATDTCGNATINVVSTVTNPGNCSGNYTVTRTWNATDACGNISASVSQTITVHDNTPPTISPAGANTTINCPAEPTFTSPTATNTCGIVTVNILSTVTIPGNCAGNYTVTRTWNATDACGNTSASVSQTITVQDNTPPSITPAGANATISCPAQPIFTAPTATDTCDQQVALTFVDLTTPSQCVGTYSITRTWTATDDCGNTSTASQTINVIDNTAPIIAELPIASTINCPAQPQFEQATATDTCDQQVALTFVDLTTPGQCVGTYSITRTWTATDDCGNTSTASQTINVIDNTAPIIAELPIASTINCPAQPQFEQATATDTCDQQVALTFVDLTTPGQCLGTYSITRTWTATDDCGNTSTASQTINVIDNTAPIIAELPIASTINCPAQPQFEQATATDTCDQQVALTFVDLTTPGQCVGTYSITRTWTATDDCGNTSTASQTINVIDNTAPIIAELPIASTINCPAQPQFEQATATDTCDQQVALTFVDVTTPGQCVGTYSITRTWTATDDCGNTSTASQTINVIDNTAPIIAELPIASTINCPAQPQFEQATATDTCDQQVALTFVDVTTPGQCVGTYSITRTWTATDDCGNTSTASQTINVIDNTAPIIAELPIASTINCPAQPQFEQATATDTCDQQVVLTFVDVTTPGQCVGTYSITRTWTATDDCGNTSTASQTINVIDNTAPIIAELPIASTINCPAQPQFEQATATDTCDQQVALTFVDVTTPGQCVGTYSITRTWTATDDCGNTSTASQTINVIDNTAPIIAELPIASTINCPAQPQFEQATATDTCDQQVALTFVDLTTPGQCVGTYSITRTWTATDDCGNNSTASQTINVIDNTAPVIAELPIASTINCPAQPQFEQATATDTCDQQVALTFVDLTTPGQCVGTYSITRTWTATDDCGNNSTASQTINVIDNTAPVIAELPIASTINCPAQPQFEQATATDTCDQQVALTFVDLTTPGQCVGTYSITRTWTATDDCGNTSTASQTINVIDNTAPIIAELPIASTINCPAQPQFEQATATDTCDQQVALTFVDLTTPGQCVGTYSITRTWTATDDCGNTSSASQTINVIDNTAPIIAELPIASTINCPAQPQFEQATATDTCDQQVALTFVDLTTPGQCVGTYSITRTWTATDDCGNTSTASQTINVIDNTAPTFVEVVPTNITVECSAVPTAVTLTAIDNCSSANVLFNEVNTAGSCSGSYTITRTWIATDLCGLQAVHIQTITVQDTTPPTFVEVVPTNITVECSAVPTAVTLTAIDNCGSANVVFNEVNTPGTCAGSYAITRSWTATDLCGLQTIHVQTITVQDTTAPTLVDVITPIINVTCSEIPDAPTPTFTDNCAGTVTVAYNFTVSNPNNDGEYQIIRTWTVTDTCNNSATFTQTVNVTIPNYLQTATLDELCNENEGFTANLNEDLESLFPGTPTNGNWVDNNNSGGLENGIFDPFGLAVGWYSFTYNYGNLQCPQSIVLSVYVDTDCRPLPCRDVIVHNAFTPNNDGYNDIFVLENITDDCYSEVSVEIYNRWGLMVYTSEKYDNFKIAFKGISEGRTTISANELLPSGVYFYALQYKLGENYINKNGYIYLNK